MKIKLFKRSIKHFFQRCYRGFSDEVTWNLDVELATWLLPRLKRFKEISPVVPYDLTEQEWNEILNKIILALELTITKFDNTTLEENLNERYKKVEEGINLLAKYFESLWW